MHSRNVNSKNSATLLEYEKKIAGSRTYLGDTGEEAE